MASFEQDKNTKLWSVRFRVIEHGVEKNKRLRGFATKKDANKAYVDFMSTYTPDNRLNTPGELTMDELYQLYIKDAELRLKPSTIYVLEKEYAHFIKPTFGDKKLKDIAKRHVIDWQNSLTAKGYAYKYKLKIRGYLSAFYTFAVKYLDYPSNIVKQCPSFAKPAVKKEMQVWSENEFNTFIEAVDKPIYKALFYTLYYTGCRKGELFALTWKDVDLKKKTISITKSLTRKCNDIYAITTPKNYSSNRTILMPDILVKQLMEYALTVENKGFLFGGAHPMSEMTLSRAYKAYCAQAGIKEIRIHDFRHSHASLLISRGASIVMVAKRLGHSSTEQTLNTYAHLMPNEEHKLVNLL